MSFDVISFYEKKIMNFIEVIQFT